MLPLITAGEVHTWLLAALAVAAGIVALIAAVRVLWGGGPRADRIALAPAPPGGNGSAGPDEDEERDDDD